MLSIAWKDFYDLYDQMYFDWKCSFLLKRNGLASRKSRFANVYLHPVISSSHNLYYIVLASCFAVIHAEVNGTLYPTLCLSPPSYSYWLHNKASL